MLQIDRLTAGYDGKPVIHGVTLEVREGEIVALVGANGAGKSTLARTLSGLLPALGGSVRFRGEDLTSWDPRRRVQAGLLHVPEGRQVFATLTIGQNLELGAYTAADTADQATRLGQVFDLFPVLRERAAGLAGNLSGGQQQMLAIGRALMGGPRLLILDEPSLGLSPLLVAEIFRLVAELRNRGVAILLSEQNARMSLSIADRGYVMENGRVAMAGNAAELLASEDVASRYLGLEGGSSAREGESGRRERLERVVRQVAATTPLLPG